MDTANVELAREQMIYHQIRPWDVTNKHVLATLGEIKREHFVPEVFKKLAFSDCEIPLACGQNMLKPVVEGRLLQALDIDSNDSVLVIGTGSGYLTACIARMADHVLSMDIHAELTDAALARLNDARVRNVELITADMNDWQPTTTWDKILVTGSMPLFDARLPEWVNDNGRLIMIVGEGPTMHVEQVSRAGQRYARRQLFETVATPLENVPQPPTFHL